MRFAVAFLLALCVAVMAQEKPVERLQFEGLPGKIKEHQQMLEKMGLPPDQAALLAVVTGGKLDPTKLMLAMMMMDGGQMQGEAFGMMMLMNVLGKSGAAEPIWWRDGDTLWVAEEGILYKIDSVDMKVLGRLEYRSQDDLEVATLGTLVKMRMGRAPQATEVAAACSSNLKQLCLAAHMFAQDHDETFPGEDWAKTLMPYLKNEQVFACPGREGLAVGYAMNEKLLGAKLGDIRRPSEIILLFEAHIGGESPVGNAADVPEVGIHDGMIGAGFADGHVKMLAPEEARRLLNQAPFE